MTVSVSMRCGVLFVLCFCWCGSWAQPQHHHVHHKYPRTRASQRSRRRRQDHLVLTLPRGGDGLLDQVEETLVDVGLKPWIQKHSVLVGKTLISSFIVAQILAYLGVIGDKGEGLYDWVVEHGNKRRKLGLQPGGFLRKHLERMLIGFASLPDRAQFVTCVSIGATVFPLLVKTVVVTVQVTLVTFVVAEGLARLGVIGDAGEGLADYIEESGSAVKSFQRWVDQTRRQLRKTLQLGELFRSVLGSLEKDRVFWAGLTVGSIASLVLDKDKVSQGMTDSN